MKINRRFPSEAGFSLADVVVTAGVIAIISAIAIPQTSAALDGWRMGMALRDVERELQFAKTKAVSTNRPMRVRFDCPEPGALRVVELIGSASVPDSNDAEGISNRCSEALYPYTPADTTRLRRPVNDGPVRRLAPGTTISAHKTIEFWPDGSAHTSAAANPWPPIPISEPATITLLRNGRTKSIKVNGLGKIIMDR